MILSLAIAINLTAALVLIAGLAYAMSRTTRLTPHFAKAAGTGTAVARSSRRPQAPHARRPHPNYAVSAAAISSKA